VAESSGQERTEQATAKRREDARREGRIAVSPDLTGAVLLLGALGAQTMAGTRLVGDSLAMIQERLGHLSAGDLSIDTAMSMIVDAIMMLGQLVWPFLVIPAAVVIVAQSLQTRFAFSIQRLAPQWNRLDPRAGLKRIVSTKGLVDLLRSIAKLALMGGVAAFTLRRAWPQLAVLGDAGPGAALGSLAAIVGALWLNVGLAFLLLGGADYAWQWWSHEQSLRMTKEEIREESKQTDGNPAVRARIRSLQKLRARRRMMAEVKRADVVVRNPTHVAVALRYESGGMAAPRVVAKGARLVARRIIEIAQAHGVPVVENRPLARALFKTVPLGGDVPRDLYRAVAEVLAYVYSLKGTRR
jgi:flagellar biosynthetic protein FlhB